MRYEFYPLMTRGGDRGIERWDPATNIVTIGGVGSVPNLVSTSTPTERRKSVGRMPPALTVNASGSCVASNGLVHGHVLAALADPR